MLQYTVRSGQNIFDVALTLHGCVEGIFDLLTSNEWLSMETRLLPGMTLNYHEELVINEPLALWLRQNSVLPRNGEHVHEPVDAEQTVRDHYRSNHRELHDEVAAWSPDEQDMFWAGKGAPRMTVAQSGQISSMTLKLKPGCHLLIDWGDYSPLQIVEGENEQEVEHCYKGAGEHVITMYGDFSFDLLDISEINGAHFPLTTIVADRFATKIDIEDLNRLIITQ